MSTPDELNETLTEALPTVHSWEGRPGADDLADLPGCPAVFLFVSQAGKPIQLRTTQQLKRVVVSRLREPDQLQAGRVDLAEVVRGVRWRQVYCPFEARWWYYRLARLLHPAEYRKLVSFGPVWFLHVDWQRRIPDPRVSERIWCLDGEFIGPWPTHRSCQQSLEGLWDLFDLCRYPEQVRKTPHGTACAYADMGRCDAPCDGSAPLARYIERCRAAWLFADGGVEAWMHAASGRMKRMAEQQRYELAGQLKQQLGFARSWQERWSPIVRREQQLNCLLVVPATRRKAWKLFLFRQGDLIDGPLLSDRKLVEQGPAWLEQQLERPVEGVDGVVRMEQTWLVAHFLRHKECGTAIVEFLPDGRLPPGVRGRLGDALRQRRGSD